MRSRMVSLVVGVFLLPSVAYAQASIAGVVRDSSGGVLPGVTVEAASPALIEKVRAAVTDSSGQYRSSSFAPAHYVVTFTLPDSNAVKREGDRAVRFATTWSTPRCGRRAGGNDHRLRRGADRRRAEHRRKQRVINREIIDAIPTAAPPTTWRPDPRRVDAPGCRARTSAASTGPVPSAARQCTAAARRISSCQQRRRARRPCRDRVLDAGQHNPRRRARK